ncbi:MAG: NADP-dependent oxidoreductase [Actinomycetia bacterium]|nr:NADP-dependent oxidoreductase [Actinomycetes bacterium]
MADASPTNTRVLLSERPSGPITPECFRVDEQPVGEPGPGEALVRNIYLSCDPYLRGRMDAAFPLDEPVTARVVGEVVASNDPAHSPGDIVWGFLGWELYSTVRGAELTTVDPALGPISHAISVRGMPGLTAWVGIIEIGRPRPGETVLVSAATGAVGSVVGQLARQAGARVVGTGGSDDKVAHAVNRLGYNAAFNYKTVSSLGAAIDEHCPDGVDVYFDNVGGDLLEAVLTRMNPGARIPVCGMISRYETSDPGIKNLIGMLASRATMTGFSIYDHVHKLPQFVPDMARRLADGSIVYDEDIVDGIDSLPNSFIGMLHGDNLGKRLVRISGVERH